MPPFSFYLKDMFYSLVNGMTYATRRADTIWADEQLRRIKFKNSILGLGFQTDEYARDGKKFKLKLTTTIKVLDRNRGSSLWVENGADITKAVLRRDVQYIRDLAFVEANNLLNHELSEVFHYDDNRVFDPHYNQVDPKAKTK